MQVPCAILYPWRATLAAALRVVFAWTRVGSSTSNRHENASIQNQHQLRRLHQGRYATLNEQAGAGNWQVDTATPDKILTVTSDKLTPAQVVQAVEQAGFQIAAA
jgi:hypothetical protein